MYSFMDACILRQTFSQADLPFDGAVACTYTKHYAKITSGRWYAGGFFTRYRYDTA
jgi:hypothetical protein